MADYLVLTLDCRDLDLQTAFWCGALGYEYIGGARQYRALADPERKQPKLLLQQVDEPKTAKCRLHVDLHVGDVADETDRLVALGATHLDRVEEFGLFWNVMCDPEGNEFCIVPTESATPH